MAVALRRRFLLGFIARGLRVLIICTPRRACARLPRGAFRVLQCWIEGERRSMASAEERRRQRELQEARKAGLAAPEVRAARPSAAHSLGLCLAHCVRAGPSLDLQPNINLLSCCAAG